MWNEMDGESVDPIKCMTTVVKTPSDASALHLNLSEAASEIKAQER